MSVSDIRFIGVGSPVVDFVVDITEEKLASIPGEKGGMKLVDSQTMQQLLELVGRGPVRSPGGSAGNTTFALARMGIACSFLGKLGTDEHGSYYRDAFREVGGDCSRFKTTASAPTARCLSLVTPDSERTMRTDLGAAMTLASEEVSPEDFSGCSLAHIEGYLLFNRDLLMSVLNAAREAGCRISLDLGSFEVVETARDILPDLLEQYVDIVFANEDEAAHFCGDHNPETGLEELGNLCATAAVKLGENGAWVKNDHETISVPAIRVDDVLDTTGAGDYWASGFLYGYLNGRSLADCGRMGALLGAHVVQYHGAILPSSAWKTILKEMRK